MNEKTDTKPGYHDFMLELINLREADYEKFLDRLYDGLVGEYAESIVAEPAMGDTKGKIEALNRMIKHFEKKEEYEKCAKLRDMAQVLEGKVAVEQ